MSFAQFLAILKLSRWTILAMTLVAVAVAYLFASSLPHQYTAKARVMLNIGNTDPTQYSVIKQKAVVDYIGTEIRLVGDEGVSRDVVEKLGWPEDPTVIAAWQQATGGRGDLVKWAARRIATGTTVNPFLDSAILEINYTAASPDAAKNVVALIRNAYIDNHRRLRVEAAARASAWNQTIAARAYADMQRAEATRVAFMKTHQIAIDSSTAGLEQRQTAQLAAQSLGRTMPKGIAPESGAMRSLRSQINMVDVQIAMLAPLGPENPQYLDALTRRAVLSAALSRETSFNSAGESATVAQLEENRRLITAEYLKARLSVLDRAPLYDELAQIDREVALRTRLYVNAMQRAKNFDLIAAAPSGLKVFGDVIGSDDPVFPDVPLSCLLAALLGLGLGIATALFGEMLSRRIRGAEDLTFYGRVAVLAVIPRSDAPRRARWTARRLQPAE